MDGLLNLVSLSETTGNPFSCQCKNTSSPIWFPCVPAVWDISAPQLRKLKYRQELLVQGYRAGCGRSRNRKCRWQGTSPFLRNRAKYLSILQLSLMYLLQSKFKVKCPFNSSSFLCLLFLNLEEKTTSLDVIVSYRKYFGFLLFKS